MTEDEDAYVTDLIRTADDHARRAAALLREALILREKPS